MSIAKKIFRGRLHPGVELCMWISVLGIGMWDLIWSPRHRGAFGAYLQIAVSLMAITSCLSRLLSGER